MGDRLRAHDEAGLRHALSAALERVSVNGLVTVLDLTDGGLVAFQVGSDEIGTPYLWRGTTAAWESPDSGASFSVPSGDLIIVNSASHVPSASAALAILRAARPDAPSWEIPGISVVALLDEAVSNSPIRQEYELLVVRADPAANRVRLSSEPLFTTGTLRGEIATLTVRCEPDGDQRAVLAVVAKADSTPHLISAWEVPLQPGPIQIEAELLGPGLVQFTKPTMVAKYHGSLSDLIATVPRTLNTVKQARLVCGIEICGPASDVAARLYRAEQLIKSLHQQFPETGQLEVAIVGYGTHQFAVKSPDDRVIVASWMSSVEGAVRSLGWLGVASQDHPVAAQLEDMLTEVVRRLPPRDDSWPTVVLILGDRPPHPVEASGGVRPCPLGHDWQESLDSLMRRPDLFVAAIRDDLAAPGTAAWARLGARKLMPLGSVNDSELWREAGIVAPSLQHVPLPIID